MTENLVVRKYGKKTVVYFLLLVILLGLAGLLQGSNTEETDSQFYYAQAAAFILGILHMIFVYRFVPSVTRFHFTAGFILTLLIMIAAVIIAAIAYHFTGMDYRFLTYVIPFCIPYLCWQACVYFFRIPPASFRPWYYPVNEEMPDLDMIDLSQIQVVQFVFSKNAQEPNQTNFTAKAPLNMPVGQLFFIFINDYNDKNTNLPIGYLTSSRQPQGWLFFRKKKWFSQKEYLDPELSFLANQVRPNEFIYAERTD